MIFVLLLGLSALALAWTCAAIGQSGLRLPAIGCTVAVMALAAVCYWYNNRVVEEAIANVEPEMMDRLRQQGEREAFRPVQLGLGLTILAAPAVLLGELRRRRNSV